MDKLKKKEDLLKEAKERCALLTQSRLTRLDPASISPKAKIPYKAMHYCAALVWRAEELARIACELYDREEVVSALTLTRSSMETAAALWFLKEKIQSVVDSKYMGEIDDVLKKLLAGSRNDATVYDAYNVMKFVDNVDKRIAGFRKTYESMCEYAHPNWLGTSYLFSKPNKEKMWSDFGKDVERTAASVVGGLLLLNNAVMIFTHTLNKVDELLPAFIKICEEDLSQTVKNSKNHSEQ